MFRLFSRSMAPGWVGCAPHGAQAALALVERVPGAAPVLRWAEQADWSDPAAALKRLKRRRALHRHRGVAVLERGLYQCLPLDAPAEVPRADWATATRWQLRDMVDFPVDSAAVDVLAVPEGASQRPRPQLIAVAAPHERLRPLVAAGRSAGCDWQALDIPETALRNLGALVAPEGRAQALLHFDDSRGLLVVTHEGELLMSRPIEVSALQLAAEDADARQSAFDRAGLELQRTLDGVERQFSQVSLARLLVTPMAGVDAFCDHLRELLYAPVLALDLGDTIDLSAAPALKDPAVLHAHLLAIGAALRD